ncbi:MAG: hypothetical protein MSH10_04225 [Pygmaiobacter massiliensis]|nr:hypothetical protein [Pygmaiobacter massiliensis]
MAFKRQTKEEKERLRRRRRRQLIGGALSILILLGIVSVVRAAAGGVAWLMDDTEEREHYEALLAPMVMLDPVPFDSLENADQSMLLQTAIWSTIYNEDLNRYERDDLGALILPSVDVDKNAALLFGPNYKLQHGTFTASGMEFVYDETTLSYTIPVTGTTSVYTPRVENIESSAKQKRVTVGYIPPQVGFSLEGTVNMDQPAKYYDYIFTRQGDGYYLTAVTDSDVSANVNSTVSFSSQAMPQEVNEEMLRQAAQADSTPDTAAQSTAEPQA